MTEFLLRRTLPRTKKVLLRELLAMVVEHESLAVAALVLFHRPCFVDTVFIPVVGV